MGEECFAGKRNQSGKFLSAFRWFCSAEFCIGFRSWTYHPSPFSLAATFSMAFPPLILFLVLPCPTVLRVPIFWGAGTQPCFFVSLSSSHFFYFRLVQWQGQLSLLNADDLHRTSRHQACWRFWRVFDSVRLSWRFSKVVADLCHALLCGDSYWKSFGCGEGECLADVCPTQWLQHFCGPKRPQFQMASKDHKGQMNGFKRICTLAPSNGSNEQQYANVTDATEEGSGRKYWCLENIFWI